MPIVITTKIKGSLPYKTCIMHPPFCSRYNGTLPSLFPLPGILLPQTCTSLGCSSIIQIHLKCYLHRENSLEDSILNSNKLSTICSPLNILLSIYHYAKSFFSLFSICFQHLNVNPLRRGNSLILFTTHLRAHTESDSTRCPRNSHIYHIQFNDFFLLYTQSHIAITIINFRAFSSSPKEILYPRTVITHCPSIPNHKL